MQATTITVSSPHTIHNTTTLEPHLQSYYNSLIEANNLSDSVTVKHISKEKGKGLFATRKFLKDEIILREKPLIAMQHVANRAPANCCSHCFKFLGTIEQQLQNHAMNLSAIENEDNMMDTMMVQHQHQQQNSNQCECVLGCVQYYCSEECREIAFENYHKLLCVGPIEEEHHPLILFKEHAIQYNELFLVAAQAIAQIILEFERNGYNLQEAMKPFTSLHQQYYWDAIDLTMNEGVTREDLEEMLSDSLQMLVQALKPYIQQMENSSVVQQLLDQHLFHLEFYSKLIGTFENNDQSITIESPLQQYLKSLQFKSQKEREEAWNNMSSIANQILQMQHEEEEEQEDDEEDVVDDVDDEEMKDEFKPVNLDEAIATEPYVFPPCEGLGMYSLEATTNHSCVPNTIVKNLEDNRAVVIALRDIEMGEELVHSYIEEESPFEERQEQLSSYGFQCDCPKCKSTI